MQVRRLLRFLAGLKGNRCARLTGGSGRAGAPNAQNAEKDWGTAKVDDLSRGMRRGAVSSPVCYTTPTVSSDEPFSGLDP